MLKGLEHIVKLEYVSTEFLSTFLPFIEPTHRDDLANMDTGLPMDVFLEPPLYKALQVAANSHHWTLNNLGPSKPNFHLYFDSEPFAATSERRTSTFSPIMSTALL